MQRGRAFLAAVVLHAVLSAQTLIICPECGRSDKPLTQQERDAAAKRQQEAARKEREFKDAVDAEVARMGEHRRAEAERMAKLKMAAAAARPKMPDFKPDECPLMSGTSSGNWRPTETEARLSGHKSVQCYSSGYKAHSEECRTGYFNLSNPKIPSYACEVKFTCNVMKQCLGGKASSAVAK